jgi:hypothetical protein
MITNKLWSRAALLLGVFVASAIGAWADHNGRTRDPLGLLKRAITTAAAPELTAAQETALTTLITNYKATLPTGDDTALEAARDAYDAALLAGNLAAAQTQATAIAMRQAQLSDARLKGEAQFKIAALANLQAGGQLAILRQRFEDDRVLDIVGSLIGRGGGRRGN